MDSLDIGRYSRQICLPQVGERGQERLTRSRVLVAGCGGLGSVLAFYLAAAGVGRIILVDRDRVEPSNLNRQILYQEAHLGQSKAKTAASTLKALNSGIRVIPVADRLTRRLLAPLIREADLAVDGTDSFNTRQVLNRACLSQGVPWVFGGVSGFNGMVSVFIPGSGPCFECVIPPPGTKTPDPGIIGPAAGITASIQAMESLKFLLGKGKLLTGRLLKLSGLDMRISYMDFTPNPHCRVCSPDTTKKDLSDHGDHP